MACFRITSGPTDPKHHRSSTVHSLTNPNLNLSEKHDDAIRNKKQTKIADDGFGWVSHRRCREREGGRLAVQFIIFFFTRFITIFVFFSKKSVWILVA